MIIAIDGTTASGKGTIARRLAALYGLPHLDTGLLYRAVGWQVALNHGDPDNEADALAACAFPDSLMGNPDLRSEAAGGLASRVSVHPAVRAALYERQRAFALQAGGAVLDGRDIASVIAPEADVKLFVDASVAVRANRRFAEMQAQGRDATLAEIAADLEARDARDRSRAEAPLVQVPDAVLIDTSALGVAEAIAAAVRVVDGCRGKY